MANLLFSGVRAKWLPLYEQLSRMAHGKLVKLTGYKTSKGAIQFPLSEPVPYDLIAEITRFRAKENNESKEDKGKRE